MNKKAEIMNSKAYKNAISHGKWVDLAVHIAFLSGGREETLANAEELSLSAKEQRELEVQIQYLDYPSIEELKKEGGCFERAD